MVVEWTHLCLLCKSVSAFIMTMAPFVLLAVAALFIGPVFLYFFQVSKLCVQIYGLVVSFRV